MTNDDFDVLTVLYFDNDVPIYDIESLSAVFPNVFAQFIRWSPRSTFLNSTHCFVRRWNTVLSACSKLHKTKHLLTRLDDKQRWRLFRCIRNRYDNTRDLSDTTTQGRLGPETLPRSRGHRRFSFRSRPECHRGWAEFLHAEASTFACCAEG